MNWSICRSAALVMLCVITATSCKKKPPTAAAPTESHRWIFESEGVIFDAEFPRARLSECKSLGGGEYGLVIRPENLPVNPSPWFAFKVSATKEMPIKVRLRCQSANLRYRPKVSTNGVHWVTLPAEAYEQSTDKTEAQLKLEVGPQTLWVAAQEPVSTDEMWAWARTMARLPFVTMSNIGTSVRGQSLIRLDIGDPNAVRHISIIGRQHPPETTGSLALMRFIEEVCGDSETARKFRGEFHVAVMPLLNPDGVDAGHWRHNMGHVDLNRDWGVFKQPETRSVSEQITAMSQKGRLFLHLDFHSTFKDVFYTQPDEEPASPAMFAARWLEGLQKRVPDYPVNRSADHTPTPTTSAFWAHKTFGIPGITYEIGDNTDRAQLKRVATAAAQEMMELMLKMKDEPVLPPAAPTATPPPQE